jgi:hypothetical protein
MSDRTSGGGKFDSDLYHTDYSESVRQESDKLRKERQTVAVAAGTQVRMEVPGHEKPTAQRTEKNGVLGAIKGFLRGKQRQIPPDLNQ